MKRVGNKKTQSMCMVADESCDILVFALRSGEIQIHQMKQQGAKKEYMHVQSLNIDNIVLTMTINRHKVRTENLLLILGTQCSKSTEQSEIVVFELDPNKEFNPIQEYSMKWIWPHNEITQIIYNTSFGLLVSSFSGAIQIFDSIDLNHSLWYNRKGLGT